MRLLLTMAALGLAGLALYWIRGGRHYCPRCESAKVRFDSNNIGCPEHWVKTGSCDECAYEWIVA